MESVEKEYLLYKSKVGRGAKPRSEFYQLYAKQHGKKRKERESHNNPFDLSIRF